MEIFWYQKVPQGDQTLCYVVYTVLYVFLTNAIGLWYKIDYNLEIEVKIIRFVLCFMTRGNFLWGSGNVI